MIHLDNDLLKEFRDKSCEWCGLPPPNDPHHIFKRGFGGGNRFDIRFNLISLCRECHRKAECDIIRDSDLCRKIIEREMWKLQRMPKEVAERFGKIMQELNHLMSDYP